MSERTETASPLTWLTSLATRFMRVAPGRWLGSMLLALHVAVVFDADATVTRAFLLAHYGLLRKFAQRTSGVAVGADAERVGPMDFQAVGDFLEDGGDVGVVDGHAGLSFMRGRLQEPGVACE